MTALRAAALVTAAASGVMGGVLFGFSSLVMPALRRRPAADAVATMQEINALAPRALGLLLVLSGPGSAVVGVWALAQGSATGSARTLLVAGAVTGAVAFAITAGFHIPRNNRLDAIDANSPAAAPAWDAYYPGWVSLNHVRAALSLGSAALVVAGATHL